MSTATTRKRQGTASQETLFVAFDLGEREWKIAFTTSLDVKARTKTLPARDTRRLLSTFEMARVSMGASRIVSCYEAGRDGFWLHRFLVAHSVENRIVDSASIEVNRRARPRKTDRLDAHKLLTMLLREALGENDVWSVVHVPGWPTRTLDRCNGSSARS